MFIIHLPFDNTSEKKFSCHMLTFLTNYFQFSTLNCTNISEQEVRVLTTQQRISVPVSMELSQLNTTSDHSVCVCVCVCVCMYVCMYVMQQAKWGLVHENLFCMRQTLRRMLTNGESVDKWKWKVANIVKKLGGARGLEEHVTDIGKWICD
jgi:hypothetical protein